MLVRAAHGGGGGVLPYANQLGYCGMVGMEVRVQVVIPVGQRGSRTWCSRDDPDLILHPGF